MAVTLNTGTIVPATGAETQVAAIAGGPFDNLSVYFQGGVGGGGGPLGLFLYATVNGVVTRVAQAQVMGAPNASIIEWSLPGGPLAGPPETTNVVSAAGTAYSVTVQDLSQGVPPPGAAARGAVTVTLAGVNEFDNAADAELSFTGALAGGATETLGPIAGWAQSLDVALSQQNLPLVQVSVVADCGAGSVQATVASVQMSGADTTIAQVFRKLALPVFTRLFVSVTNLSQTNVPNLSLTAATTSIVVTASAADITPGPQITVLRSVVPTVPTKVVWASSGYIDFVADCGADPTGAADCAPAFDRAFALLSALSAPGSATVETAVRLFIPPGLYNLLSAPTIPVWNFTNLASNVEIVGAGMDSTVIQLHGFDPPSIQSCTVARLADFTTMGASSGLSLDCTNGWEVAFVELKILCERLRFFRLVAGESALFLAETETIHVTDCTTSNTTSRSIGGMGGVLWVVNWTSCAIDSCNFNDVGNMNGLVPDASVLSGGTTWLNALFTRGVGPEPVQLSIRDCIFDEEGATDNVRIIGDPNPIGFVFFENCFFNPPTQGGSAGSCMVITNVEHLRCWGCYDSQFHLWQPGNVVQNFATLTGVVVAEFLDCQAAAASPNDGPNVPPQITCDAVTTRVIVRNAVDLDWSHINNPTVLDIDQPRSSGNPHGATPLTATQIVVVEGQQIVQGTTVAAAPSGAVDTFYKPPATHAARLDVVWVAYDATAPSTTTASGSASVRENGGATVIAASSFGANVGDAALATATVVLGVSAGGTITITFEPPSPFADNMTWVAGFRILEDPNFT